MKKSLYEVLKTFARPIITIGVVVILSIMASAVICVAIGRNDTNTWVKFGVGFLLQTLMILVWLPEGKNRGAENETFKQNKKAANERIRKVATPQYFSLLDEFCAYAHIKNLQNYVSSHLDSSKVDYHRYLIDEQYVSSLDEKIVRKIKLLEKRAVRRVKQIKSTEITSNSNIDLVFDVWDHTKSKERTMIAFRLVPSCIMAFVGAAITILPEPITWNTVALLVYWLVTIASTILFSIKTGYELMTVTENDYSLRVIDFLERFDGWMLEKEGQDNLTELQTEDETVN